MGEGIRCVFSVVLWIVLIVGFLAYATKCHHEHRVIEWHGSLHEVTIHTTNCPEIER